MFIWNGPQQTILPMVLAPGEPLTTAEMMLNLTNGIPVVFARSLL